MSSSYGCWWKCLNVQSEEELKTRYVEPRIGNILSGYRGLLESLKIEAYDDKYIRLDESLCLLIVRRYLKLLAQRKLINDYQNAAPEKVGGYLGYWILRFRPIQFISDLKDIGKQPMRRSLTFSNEILAFHVSLGLGLEQGQDEKIISLLKQKKDRSKINRYWSALHHLCYNPITPDTFVRELFAYRLLLNQPDNA